MRLKLARPAYDGVNIYSSSTWPEWPLVSNWPDNIPPPKTAKVLSEPRRVVIEEDDDDEPELPLEPEPDTLHAIATKKGKVVV